MRLGAGRPAALVAAVAAAVSLGMIFSPSVSSVAGLGTQKTATSQTSTVGALFTLTPAGALGSHFCTASVVDSPAGDLVLTAAHCMKNRSPGTIAFVPDYERGRGPFGIWTVTKIMVDQAWSTSADPDDDFAFLIVNQQGSTAGVQQFTGGEFLGVGAAAGKMVEVAGYPDSQDGLISCDNTAIAFSPTQFEFDCDGFTDGTSGSPLLTDSDGSAGTNTVIGVIGGYEQGGSTASVSYAARFSARLAALYRVALNAAGR